MISAAAWLFALAPLALLALGLVPSRSADRLPQAMGRLGLAAALAGLASAVIAAIVVAVLGPVRTGVPGPHGIGPGLDLDALSVTVLLVVAFIGAIVLAYSRTYLDGDPGQGRFLRWLCLTLAAVQLLVVAGSLVQLALAWVLTSVGLHRLLQFYAERPVAVLAARKKLIVSRAGDACLLAAMLLLLGQFGSLEHAVIRDGAQALRDAASVPGTVGAAAIFLALAALLKSAQFPLHGWLTEVMETPTPVSALLHAGVINAGGFLVLRFADVMVLSAPALTTLAVIGGLTALFGALVMLTQTSIKSALAWSTVAQMGFMLLQCGLAAFPAALLHIVAHALYKAHAFLTSGGAASGSRAAGLADAGGRRLLVGGLLAAVALLVVTLAGQSAGAPGAAVALGAILALGLGQLVIAGAARTLLPRILGLAGLVGLAYALLHGAAAWLASGTLPAPLAAPSPLLLGLVVAGFAVASLVPWLLARPGAGALRLALHVHLANGLYVNTLANRLVLRLWPAPVPRRSNNASMLATLATGATP
ncbi:MAG: proton-conducting transporter membrane subunit [Geminicoccaceae bacterium]